MKPYCNVLSFGDLLGISLTAAINAELYTCNTSTDEDRSVVHYYHLAASKARLYKFIDESIATFVEKRRREHSYRKSVIVFTCKVKHNKYFEPKTDTFEHSTNSYYIIDESEMPGFKISLHDLNGLVEHFLKSTTKLFKDKRNIKVSYPTLSYDTMSSVIKSAYTYKTCVESFKSILVDPNTFLAKKSYTTEAHITQFIIEQLGLRLGE